MTQAQNIEQGEYELEEGGIYDRIALDGEYFDYASTAQEISSLVQSNARILELCVGSGNLALEMASLGHHVTGVDSSTKMLEKCRTKLMPSSDALELVEGNAATYLSKEKYDAVVLHSGHLIINRTDEGELRLNGEQEAMLQTVESTGSNLVLGGKLIMNIEHWYDKVVRYPDGSLYIRIIREEEADYGTRVHIFYDHPTNKIVPEIPVRQPKIPFESFTKALVAAGFEDIAMHTSQNSLSREQEPPTLFVATLMK